LRGPEAAAVLAHGMRQRMRERGQQRQGRLFRLELIGVSFVQGAGHEADRQPVARAQAGRPSSESAEDVLEQMRRDSDDGALVAIAGRMPDTVFVLEPEKQRSVGVDYDRFSAAFDDENTTPRQADLRP